MWCFPSHTLVPSHVTIEELISPEHDGSEGMKSGDHELNWISIPFLVENRVQPEYTENSIENTSRYLYGQYYLVNVASVLRGSFQSVSRIELSVSARRTCESTWIDTILSLSLSLSLLVILR